MGYEIKKVAVLGAGVMGQGIAAHLANAGIPSVLYDIVPGDAGEGNRSKLAVDGIKNATKLKPAAFYRKSDSAMITPANYEDHGELLAECDWIVEVVVENLNIKKKVYQWISDNRREGSIVSSNTSGISLAAMAEGMNDEMRSHFLVTHFFNPVRYMRLLELVSGDDTNPEVTAAIAEFGQKVLGKGIVYGKDTPNFVANRVGCYGMVSVFKHMTEIGVSVAEVDTIFGKAMGRPKSAVFRTADLVGLDTLDHVFGNVYDGSPEDEARAEFVSPDWIKKMIEEGAIGEKSGKGFYKKGKVDGKKTIFVRDIHTGEYAPKGKVRFASIKAAREADDLKGSLNAILAGDDKAAQMAWAVTADTLIYSANRIPTIADDIVNIDRGMKWGFAWDMGPFETWDAIGVRASVERMEKDGRTVPQWVKDMLAAGRESFYLRDAEGQMTYWDGQKGESVRLPTTGSWLILNDLKENNKVVKSNFSADLMDLGDGVLGLSFKSKMNALDDDIIGLYGEALDMLDAGQWEALVVGNQGGMAFSAGANLMMIGWAAMGGDWDKIEFMVRGLQQTLQRAKYSKRPVVTAPWGLTLGGGAEVAMQSSATQAAGELYMGLVEVGVGLIPGGGGCKEVLSRYLGDIPSGVEYDSNNFVQAAFKNIAMATVATSAEEARAIGYLRPTDRLTLDPDALIQDAKDLALGLVKAGYRPPRERTFRLPGTTGRAAIELFLGQMAAGGYATPHDVTVGKRLAHVMTGGNISANQEVTEQHILDLEVESFLGLCGETKTHERIQHMLTTGKPLRN